jgi:hypothetical protein
MLLCPSHSQHTFHHRTSNENSAIQQYIRNLKSSGRWRLMSSEIWHTVLCYLCTKMHGVTPQKSNCAQIQRPAGHGTPRSTSTEHHKSLGRPTSESMHCDWPVEMWPCVIVPLRISCCPDANVSPWWCPVVDSPSWSSLSAQRACPHALFT